MVQPVNTLCSSQASNPWGFYTSQASLLQITPVKVFRRMSYPTYAMMTKKFTYVQQLQPVNRIHIPPLSLSPDNRLPSIIYWQVIAQIKAASTKDDITLSRESTPSQLGIKWPWSPSLAALKIEPITRPWEPQYKDSRRELWDKTHQKHTITTTVVAPPMAKKRSLETPEETQKG